jgi:hypothetical protein
MATQPFPPVQPQMPQILPGYMQQQMPDPMAEPPTPPGFYDNLADQIDGLAAIGQQIIVWQRDDEAACSMWVKGWSDAAEYLGLTVGERNIPWRNASGIYDSLMLECQTRFCAEGTDCILSSNGPCRAEVFGELNDQKQQAAIRVADHMNWWLLDGMDDFAAEFEQLFWGMGFCGIGFKKVTRDPITGEPQSNYVRANMLWVPGGYSTIRKAPRIIEYMPMQLADVEQAKASGWYSQDFNPTTGRREFDRAEEAEMRRTGQRPPLSDDMDVELLEAHVKLKIDPDPQYGNLAYPLPYVVTLDKRNGTVGSIRRNWVDGDAKFKRRETYVEYVFVPTDMYGIYGIGLAHMLCNSARAKTGLTRGMLDAGTLNNLRGGFRKSSVRTTGDNTEFEPGEWKVIESDSPSLSDDFWSPDYKPPDATLLALLGELDDSGRRLAGNADINISEIGSQTPVGTVLAVIERGMKVFNSIQGRIARSFKKEIQLIREIILEDLRDNAEWIQIANKSFPITAQDYEDATLVPSVDPDSGTVSQRILQTQAAIQMVAQIPGPFNVRQAARQALMALGVKDVDNWVPPEPIIPRLDPVSENARVIVGEPVQAFKDQDHEAHLQTHQAVLQSQQLTQALANDPQLQTKAAAAMAHISQHLAFQQRLQIEKYLGYELPDQMTPDQENRLAPLIAQAAQLAAQNPPQPITLGNAPPTPPDPIAQQNAIDNQLKQQELAQKAEIERNKLNQKTNQDSARNQLEAMRIQQTHQVAEQNLALRGAKGTNPVSGPVTPGGSPLQ